jgi:hypothetical protein
MKTFEPPFARGYNTRAPAPFPVSCTHRLPRLRCPRSTPAALVQAGGWGGAMKKYVIQNHSAQTFKQTGQTPPN